MTEGCTKITRLEKRIAKIEGKVATLCQASSLAKKQEANVIAPLPEGLASENPDTPEVAAIKAAVKALDVLTDSAQVGNVMRFLVSKYLHISV